MPEEDSEAKDNGIFEFGTREKPYTIPTGDVEDIIYNTHYLADKQAQPAYFEFHRRIFKIERGFNWEMVQGTGKEEEDDFAKNQMGEWVGKVKQEQENKLSGKQIAGKPKTPTFGSKIRDLLKRR